MSLVSQIGMRDNLRRQQYLADRTPAQLQVDLVKAFDQIELLKLKVWILTGLAIAQAGVITWLANELFSRIK